MQDFYFSTIGSGKINIILLSGWGLSSKIWFFITQKFQSIFKFYLIDLPGCGSNKTLYPMKIDEVVKILHHYIPKNSIWMGWSIGGLIACKFALLYPKHMLAIITVASSPCFIEKNNWPGIKQKKMEYFYFNLTHNYYHTIKNFLSSQIINTNISTHELLFLKKILLSNIKPSLNCLKNGLQILSTLDLRLDISYLNIPLLRIYGELDNLVPKKIAKILDSQWPNTNSVIIKKAAHIPFFSHKKIFCSILQQFLRNF